MRRVAAVRRPPRGWKKGDRRAHGKCGKHDIGWQWSVERGRLDGDTFLLVPNGGPCERLTVPSPLLPSSSSPFVSFQRTFREI